MKMTAALWRLSGHKNLKASDQAIGRPVYVLTPVCSWQLKLTLCSSSMPVNTLMGPWGTSDINVMGQHHMSFFLLRPFLFLTLLLAFFSFLFLCPCIIVFPSSSPLSCSSYLTHDILNTQLKPAHCVPSPPPLSHSLLSSLPILTVPDSCRFSCLWTSKSTQVSWTF